jgi:protein-tyrosine phosphatase
MDDYLLTQRFFHPQREIDRLQAKYQMEHLDAESMLPMLEVHRDYLDRALDTIDQNFPSIEVYLEQELGVGAQALSRLRDRYLAPAGRQG